MGASDLPVRRYPPSFRFVDMCKGKHRHRSIGAAKAHIRSLARERERQGLKPKDAQAYWCTFCGYYHVGGRS